MKFTIEQLINFWAGVAMFSLVLSAISLFFFRYYSGKKTEQSFTQIGAQITTEVNKTIEEIDGTKETLQLKLTNEVESVITELKSNAKSANDALESLKSETSSLVKDVKKDLSILKEETKVNLEVLKNPIGIDFNLVAFKFRIANNHFQTLENKLIKTGELTNAINRLKRDKVVVGSIGISKKSTPDALLELGAKLKWIRIRVVDKVTEDINTCDQLMSIQFDNIDGGNISLNKQIDKNYNFKDFILVVSSDKISSTDVKKTKGITSSNDLCNKLVLIESAFDDFHPSKKPYNLEIGNLYFTDNKLNAYQFFPIKNIAIGLFPETLKNMETYKAIPTLGILKCKNK